MSDPAPHTIIGLFAGLGGTSAVARALGVGQSGASEMKRRGSIPVKYWDRLIGLENSTLGRPVTLEDLHRIHRQPEAV